MAYELYKSASDATHQMIKQAIFKRIYVDTDEVGATEHDGQVAILLAVQAEYEPLKSE